MLLIKKILYKNYIYFHLSCHYGEWGLGIGDWGLGIGDWAQSPIPNPQSPIPNPQSPIPIKLDQNNFDQNKKTYLLLIEIIKLNTAIEELDLSENNLTYNETIFKLFCLSLGEN